MRTKISVVLFSTACISVFFIPIIIGLIISFNLSFSYIPNTSYSVLNLSAWHKLFEYHSIIKSSILTIFIGWTSSLLALMIALFSCVYLSTSKIMRYVLASYLSIPHVAFATGVIFLFAPSGWIIRLISPWMTDYLIPPTFSLVNDLHGFSLIFVLICKEVPFLIWMILANLSQINYKKQLAVSKSLGYGQSMTFFKIILPQLLPRMRLPLLAVIAYGLSCIDLTLVIGPNSPLPLVGLIHHWLLDAEIDTQFIGNAGSIYLLIITIVSMCTWIIIEKTVLWYIIKQCKNGNRKNIFNTFNYLVYVIFIFMSLLIVVILIMLILWSFTKQWSFPDVFPNSFSIKFLMKYTDQIWSALLNSIWLAVASIIIGSILVIGCLENISLNKNKNKMDANITLKGETQKWLWLVYIPLLVPQISFLFGFYIFILYIDMNNYYIAVLWAHLIFVIPYLILTLNKAYLSFDNNYLVQAMILSGSYWKSLFRIKLPMLITPILYAMAIGFTVSIAQYLATLYIGGGRLETITTEAITSASGGNRRIIAIYSMYQWLLCLLAFTLFFIFSNQQTKQWTRH